MRTTPTDNAEREIVRRKIKGSMVVEAGAGTGKTSLLIERIVSLLSEFSITDLVAITFTEKAAGELRDRLRQALEAKVISKKNDKPDPKILNALDNIDRAAISTIHSFASSLIRERPFEVGLEPDFQHFDEADENDLLMEALRNSLTGRDDHRDRLISQFLLLGGNLNRLTELLYLINGERELLPFFKGRTSFVEPSNWFDSFRIRIAELNENSRKNCLEEGDPGKRQIEKLAQLMPSQEVPDDEDAWRWLIELTGISPNKGKQGSWTDPDLCKVQKTNLKELKEDALDVYEKSGTAVLEELIIWLSGLILRTEELKLENGQMTFQDLLIFSRRLLEKPLTLGHFQHRFKRILIDEFQDTDPLQVEIAMYLAAKKSEIKDRRNIQPEMGKICLIGDPKQSIYRFRRADNRIYTQATERVIKQGEKVIIKQNFRSAPGIIEFVNSFFTPIWIETDGGCRYEPLTADPDRSDSEPSPPVTIINHDEPLDSVLQVREKEAGWNAKIIDIAVNREKWQVTERNRGDGISYRSVSYGDIAILFPRMTGIDSYSKALTDAGIPYNIEKGRDFYNRQIVRDLYHCLVAVDNPADRLSVCGALRSGLFGLSDAELAEWMDKSDGRIDYREEIEGIPEGIESVLSILRKLHSERFELTTDRLIERLLEYSDLIPALLSDRFTEIDIGAVENLLAMARRYEGENSSRLRGFVRRLRKRLEDGGKEDVAPITGEVDYVRLMTVHAAKGLEFPVVILANLGEGRSQREKLIPYRLERSLEVEIGGKSDGFRTTGYMDAAENEEQEKSAEAQRLLYVAMTRARDHLVLPCLFKKSPTGYTEWIYDLIHETGDYEGLPMPSYRLLTDDRLPASVQAVKEPVETLPDVSSVWDERTAWQSERASRLKNAVQKIPKVTRPSRHDSYSSEPYPALSVKEKPETVVEGDEPDRTAVGRALHKYMALIDPFNVPDDALADYVAREEGILREHLDPLLSSCLNGELWREAITAVRVWREVPVSVRTSDGILLGVIDLVWEDGEGLTHIGDWKSGSVQPERHAAQMRDYAWAVEQATGREVASVSLFYAESGKKVIIELDG
ncbi:UvrD-helicase domain-containing protein [bacterium]|nr:UvrD-helicase domain-containing protein [bacterium]